MGLDMFLYKKTFTRTFTSEGSIKAEVSVKVKDVEESIVESDKVVSVTEEVGYWRKANHIHKWFVDNVQNGTDDCKKWEVSLVDIQDLRDVCEKVLANENNTALAEQLLPREEGFFFGDQIYNEWYYSDIKDTLKIIDNVLGDKNGNGKLPFRLFYQSSW